MKNQQGISYQRDLFIEQELKDMRQCECLNAVNKAQSILEGQVNGANKQGRALADCFSIFVRSQRASERVMDSVIAYLTTTLS